MHTIEVKNISKTFGEVRAVDDLSFSVEKGEIFGMLGPNGSGKTTSLRIILDIFKPESGTVSILGGPMTEEKKNRIGYMPEERGLYQDATLERSLIYLAALKGLNTSEIQKRLDGYLEKFDLLSYKKKKVKTLSKGMQQKAQIISTILHNPELIIIDEPFTGLDPINTQLVKDMMRQLRKDGATILMSTHMMHQVEELCDRIVLIDNGRDILYGKLNDIQRQFSGHAVLVKARGEIPSIDGVMDISPYENATRLTLADKTDPQAVLDSLRQKNVVIEQFKIALPSLDEIFIKAVNKERNKNV